MISEINTKFKITGWEETVFSEAEGAGKLTKASVARSFEGDLKGEGKIEYLMAYSNDGSAVYTGYERVTGKVQSKSGSFVLKHEGNFKNGIAEAECIILENSGTGKLKEISGKGKFKAGHDAEHDMILNIILP